MFVQLKPIISEIEAGARRGGCPSPVTLHGAAVERVKSFVFPVEGDNLKIYVGKDCSTRAGFPDWWCRFGSSKNPVTHMGISCEIIDGLPDSFIYVWEHSDLDSRLAVLLGLSRDALYRRVGHPTLSDREMMNVENNSLRPGIELQRSMSALGISATEPGSDGANYLNRIKSIGYGYQTRADPAILTTLDGDYLRQREIMRKYFVRGGILQHDQECQ